MKSNLVLLEKNQQNDKLRSDKLPTSEQNRGHHECYRD